MRTSVGVGNRWSKQLRLLWYCMRRCSTTGPMRSHDMCIKKKEECFCNTLFLFSFAAMIYVFLIINLFSGIMFGLDKRKAVLHRRRIPETTLLGISFLGGSIGAILAMLIFRHKISKTSFLLKFGFIVLIQVALIYFFEKNIEMGHKSLIRYWWFLAGISG